MSILSFKGDTVAKLTAHLAKNEATAKRVHDARVQTIASLVDVEQRLAVAVLEQDGAADALQVERGRLADRLVTLDLASRKADDDAAELRLRISAETNKAERETVAAQLEAQADRHEKSLVPLRKFAQEMFDAYNANSRTAAEMTPGSNPQVLAFGVDFVASFIAGDALDLLIEADRRVAKELREGRRDPAAFKVTFGGQYESFHGKKKAVR